MEKVTEINYQILDSSQHPSIREYFGPEFSIAIETSFYNRFFMVDVHHRVDQILLALSHRLSVLENEGDIFISMHDCYDLWDEDIYAKLLLMVETDDPVIVISSGESHRR